MTWIEPVWISRVICSVLRQGDEVLEEQTLNNNVDEINQGRGNLHPCMFLLERFAPPRSLKHLIRYLSRLFSYSFGLGRLLILSEPT